jgi:hypothetical protein
MTVSLSNFPSVTRTDEVVLSVDGANVLVRKVAGNSAEFFLTIVTPEKEAGTYEVAVSSPAHPHLPAITFDLSFEAHPPMIVSVRPARGSQEGGTIVNLKLRHFTPVDDISEISVVNDGTTWTVEEIVYSDTGGTSVTVIAPPSDTAGTMNLLVTHTRTQESVYFQYRYFDGSLTVETVGVECTDGDSDKHKLAALANCVTRDSSTPAPIEIVAKGFPAVLSAANMAVTFGSEPGTVDSVSYDSDTKLLTVQVTPPQFTAESDSDWDTGGWHATESQLFLPSDQSKSVTFHTVYVRPLEIASVEFKSQNSFLDITFNQPTNGGEVGTRMLCSDIVDVADLELMGHSPAEESDDCLWQSPNVLRVLYKPRPDQTQVLAPGDGIHFRGGMLLDDGEHAEALMSNQTVVVLSDSSAAAPEAALVGSTTLGFCDPLVLDAAASKGTRVKYQWRCLNDDNLDELLKTASDSKISIAPADIMKKDFAFKVAVSVEDFSGTTSTEKVLDVYRSSSPLPIIFIDSDAEIFVEPGEGIFLKGKAEFSSCVEPSEIEFSWALGQDGSDLTVLGSDAIPGSDGEASDQYELGGRVINVRPNVLVPGQTYTFELTGAPIGEPANAASASVVVHVLRPALTADIAGGSREVSSLREVVIDGSKSKDPSDVSSLAYEWSCFSRDLDDVCRDATTNEVLAFGDVPRISLAEGSLAEGEYDFTLQVTDYTEQEDGTIVEGSRFAGAAVSLKMIELPIPDVSISANTAAMVVSKSGQINANSKIALTGIANNLAEASDIVRIEGVWEVSGVDGLDLTDVEVAPLGINLPEFVINGNQIPAGSNVNFVYRTSVFTTLGSGEEDVVSASARFSLSVNLPPSSGSCEVYPAEGFALETDFSISCNGWKDEANSAIRYEFIAVTDAGEITLQSTATNAYELPAFSMPSPQVACRFLLETPPHYTWIFSYPFHLSHIYLCIKTSAIRV